MFAKMDLNELQDFLGGLAVAISLPAYVIYTRNIFKGKTRPQMYSWLIWGTLASVGFLGQVSSNAGPGAWVTGVTALSCLLIFSLAIFKGAHDLAKLDKVLLSVAVVAVAIRIFTHSPLVSSVMATLAGLVGFNLTIKKAYQKPYEETAISFALNGIKFFPALFALNKTTVLTFAYPFCMMLANLSVVWVVLVRRRAVKHTG